MSKNTITDTLRTATTRIFNPERQKREEQQSNLRGDLMEAAHKLESFYRNQSDQMRKTSNSRGSREQLETSFMDTDGTVRIVDFTTYDKYRNPGQLNEVTSYVEDGFLDIKIETDYPTDPNSKEYDRYSNIKIKGKSLIPEYLHDQGVTSISLGKDSLTVDLGEPGRTTYLEGSGVGYKIYYTQFEPENEKDPHLSRSAGPKGDIREITVLLWDWDHPSAIDKTGARFSQNGALNISLNQNGEVNTSQLEDTDDTLQIENKTVRDENGNVKLTLTHKGHSQEILLPKIEPEIPLSIAEDLVDHITA